MRKCWQVPPPKSTVPREAMVSSTPSEVSRCAEARSVRSRIVVSARRSLEVLKSVAATDPPPTCAERRARQ